MIGADLTEVLRNLWVSKQRTLIVLTGIVVGIGAVIAMISLGVMAQDEARRQFANVGTDIVTIRNDPSGVAQGSRPNFSRQLKELLDIPVFCPTVGTVAPSVSPLVDVSYGGKKMSGAFALGITNAFLSLQQLRIQEGRFLTNIDEKSHFCVVGEGVAKKMMQIRRQGLLGERIRVGTGICSVAGVVAPAQKGFMRDIDVNMAVYIPFVTAQRMTGDVLTATTTAQVKQGIDNNVAMEQIGDYFGKHTRVKSYKITSPEEMVAQMERQMRLYTLLLSAVGSIALIMGGVGIMNVMISSVMERRREIGIRRALGAKRRDIRNQFLLEAFILSLIGGIFGILLGEGASFIIAHFTGWHFVFSPLALVGGLGISISLGLVFGLYPAHQASKLDPILTLHKE
ncbi:MAG: ABC transporter permease [Deltaproteobacteria bacterium]|nr:ABC transporter permease [Deltaproteobacteria bacterium]